MLEIVEMDERKPHWDLWIPLPKSQTKISALSLAKALRGKIPDAPGCLIGVQAKETGFMANFSAESLRDYFHGKKILIEGSPSDWKHTPHSPRKPHTSDPPQKLSLPASGSKAPALGIPFHTWDQELSRFPHFITGSFAYETYKEDRTLLTGNGFYVAGSFAYETYLKKKKWSQDLILDHRNILNDSSIYIKL